MLFNAIKQPIKTIIGILAAIIIFASSVGCSNSLELATRQNDISAAAAATPIGLHTSFKDHFMIGTALSAKQIMGKDESTLNLVKKEFNAVTPENVMKWEFIHPKPNVYDFAAPDKLAEFAANNNIFLVGHTLLWHNQTPEWVFKNRDGSQATRQALLNRLEDHINTVAGRYQNRVHAWDVVNEALNEDGSLRESQWLQIIGDDYIEQAFIMAAKAAPDAKLYYNDYNLFEPLKRQGAVKLIKSLQSKGIKIDGIGIQGHYGLKFPDLKQLEDSINAFASLGIDIMISELDVTVLPFPKGHNQGADITLNVENEKHLNPYPNGLPADVKAKLDERYQEIFAVLNKYSDIISRVSFWGVDDATSWRNNWPVKGRTDYPLLFDRQMKKKSFVASLPAAK